MSEYKTQHLPQAGLEPSMYILVYAPPCQLTPGEVALLVPMSIKFCTYIEGPHGRKPIDGDDALTFFLAPPLG